MGDPFGLVVIVAGFVDKLDDLGITGCYLSGAVCRSIVCEDDLGHALFDGVFDHLCKNVFFILR